MAWMAKINKMMEYPGVTHHGRVSQPEMHKEMKKHGIWAYPTHFGEISCITAMKAQALGCIPVVVDYAALETTVQFGIKVHGDIYDPKVANEFKSELISLMKDSKRQESIRKEMVTWAKKEFTWDKVAEQWTKLFKGENVTGLIPTR
jgi:glycosyltransferase involved in cell wall biosynthesis